MIKYLGMIRICFTVLTLVIIGVSAFALPTRVMIIRHAEKPTDPTDPHLSPVGYQRAEALKNIFTLHPEYAVPRPPDKLFAAGYIPGESSLRSFETLVPLAAHLNLNISERWTSNESYKFGNELFYNREYDKAVILIAWKHSEIPQLARGLRAPCKSTWNFNTFDRVWLIDFSDGQITCKDVPQSVLPGDSRTSI